MQSVSQARLPCDLRDSPAEDRRLVGPLCFLERVGPTTSSEGKPPDVAPHPRFDLQTG